MEPDRAPMYPDSDCRFDFRRTCYVALTALGLVLLGYLVAL